MRRRFFRGILATALAVTLSLVVVSVAFAVPGNTHGNSADRGHGPKMSTTVLGQLPVVQKGGPAAGGTEVTIKGRGFEGATAVTFGVVPATSFAVASDRVITAVAPAGTVGQTVAVTVTTPAGTSAGDNAAQYRYKDAKFPGSHIPGITAPAVRHVAPKAGPVTGGARVMVIGVGFQDVTAVTFGTVPATAFKVLSTRVIVATSPAGTAGQVDVTVTTAKGTSPVVESDHYTYKEVMPPVVRRVGPDTGGPAAGGARVMIIGDNFRGVTSVMFAAVPATSFKVLNSHVIAAVSPAGTEGSSVDVTVTTAKGTSAITAADLYLYKTPDISGQDLPDADD
jgi:hypothetical protein